MSLALVLASLVPFAVPAPPQAPAEKGPVWRTLPDVTTLTAAAAGDVTGDGVIDVVVVADGEPVLVFGPTEYGAGEDGALAVPVRIAGGPAASAVDVALLPRTGPGLAEGIVTSGASGLTLWRWDGAGAFTAQALGTGLPAVSQVAVWAPDGATTMLVCAAAADGSAVHTLGVSAETGAVVLQLPGPALAPGTVTDLQLVNLDATDDQPELVVVRPTGVEIVDFDASSRGVIGAWPAGAGGHAAVLRTPDRRGERVAWVTGMPIGAARWLFVVSGSRGGLAVEPPVVLGTDAVLALAAGDWTADAPGVQDLLVVTDGATPLTVLRGQTPEPTFDTDYSEGVAAGGLTPGAVGAALLVDLDRDGDADALLLEDVRGGALVHRSPHRVSALHRPDLTFVDADAVAPIEDEEEIVIAWVAEMELQVDGAAGTVPAGANRVEIVVRGQLEGAFLGGAPIDAAGADLPARPGAIPLTVSVVLPPDDPSTPDDDEHIFGAEVRWVRRVAGEPVAAWPATPATLVFDWSPETRGARVALGLPALRGDMDPLDDIPPFGDGDVPLNP